MLPGGLTTITVTDAYSDITGNPLGGSVTFTATCRLADGNVVFPIQPVTVPVNQATGTFTVTLPCTDNSGLSPAGQWAYRVMINVQGMDSYPFTVLLPSTLGASVQLSAVAPSPPFAAPSGMAVYSINGQTGAVVLTASELGAVPLAGGTMTGPLYASESPLGATEVATKGYVDAATTGLTAKPAVQEATTAALATNTYNGTAMTLTATSNGALTVDGVTVAVADRVLVKNEAAQANNGIYAVTATGSVSAPYVLTRAQDMNSAAEIPGAFALVEKGTANTDTGWFVASAGPFTLGTTAIVWAYQSGGLVLDTTDNAQPLGTAAPGSVGKAADAGHVHPTTSIINGVAVSGTPATGKAIICTSGSAATWQTADTLAIDTTASDIKPLAASAAAGSLTQAPAADHIHPTTGLVVSGESAGGDLSGTYPTSLTVAKIQGTSISSPPGGTTQFLAGNGTWQTPAGGGGGGSTLVPTVVKTSAYTAAVNDFVPVDTTSGSVTITLPNAPAAESQIGVKLVVLSGSNTVTVARNGSGTDVFNVSGGSTTLVLSRLFQTVLLEYASGIWYVTATDPSIAIDATSGDIAALGSQAAGSVGKAADAGHVHPTTGLVLSSSLPLGLSSGGTGTNAGSANAAFNALSPLTTSGDMLYENSTPAGTRLAGNSSATKNYLTMTSSVPAWGAIAAADLPAGTTSTQGALQLDGTGTDIAAAGIQAAGSVGKAADAGHIHPLKSWASAALAPTGAIAETFPRMIGGGTTGATNSAQLYVTAIALLAGNVVSNITLANATTASGLSHGWYILVDSGLVVRAASADQTSATWGSAGLTTLAMGTPYTIPSTGLYYIGWCLVASGMPTWSRNGGAQAAITGAAPILCGASGSATQTTPPSTGSSISSLNSASAFPVYGYVS